jgi:hypothetical protein
MTKLEQGGASSSYFIEYGEERKNVGNVLDVVQKRIALVHLKSLLSTLTLTKYHGIRLNPT